MQYKQITGTDLSCATFCLGGGVIGSTLNQEESFRLMDLYAERGGNFIDTAEVYANWLPIEASISEKTIGRWMKSRNNRNRMIVTTKGAHPRLQTMQVSRMSREDIVHDVENSLRHLQVDTVDLYFLHRDDPNRSVQEIIDTLHEQVKAGKIRYFGCSNWTLARLMEAQNYAESQGIRGFAGNQMMWSLAEVDSSQFGDPTLVAMDGTMKRYHAATGLSAFPYSSQANGLFTKWGSGAYTADDERISPMYRSAENRNRFGRAQRLANELSVNVTQIALAYLASYDFPVFPIIGCRTAEQLEESLKAVNLHLTTGNIQYLENS